MLENDVAAATTIGEARAAMSRQLSDTLEIDHLLCTVLNCKRSRLYAHQQEEVGREHGLRLQALLRQRLQGVPLAYLTGSCEFFSLEFETTSDALIPRPATETLVEVALAAMKRQASVLELGTGCGAIAVTLAHRRADSKITACDIDTDALALAKRNARRHGVEVDFIESDWFASLEDRRFDLIVANPPYIGEHDLEVDPEVVAYEPHTALFASERGLACLRQIIANASKHLNDRGVLALEHGHTQASQVKEMMLAAGLYEPSCKYDLAGHPRVSISSKTLIGDRK